MALTEEVVIDQITVKENGVIEHRTSTRIFRDGVKIAETYHRGSIEPGQDYSGLDKRITDIADLVHTTKVKEDFSIQQQAAMDSRVPERPVV